MKENIKPRVIQLDVLRCVAVVLVIFRHSLPCPPDENYVLHVISSLLVNGGWIGVDLFFVLSGFLVSGLLFSEYQKTGDVGIKRFLIRRGFKIYPAFWVWLSVTIITILFVKRETIPLRDLLGEVLFLQNIIGRLSNHTWSLAVEEHFYIGLATLVFILLWRKKRAKSDDNPFSIIPQLFLVIALTCLTLRLLMLIFKGINAFPTPFRIDSLFFGVAISYFWRFRQTEIIRFTERFRYVLFILGIALLSPFFFIENGDQPFVFVPGLTITYIGSGLVLMSILTIDISESKIARFLATIGTYSYSIYLWHIIAQHQARNFFEIYSQYNYWLIYTAFHLVTAILLGVFMSKLIEYPALRIRDKYFPT